MVVILGEHYNVGEKLTVILYTFTLYAGTPNKQNKNNVVIK